MEISTCVLGCRADPTVRSRPSTLISLCDNVILSSKDENSVDLDNLSWGYYLRGNGRGEKYVACPKHRGLPLDASNFTGLHLLAFQLITNLKSS